MAELLERGPANPRENEPKTIGEKGRRSGPALKEKVDPFALRVDGEMLQAVAE